MNDAYAHSLADFYLTDSASVTEPPADYLAWASDDETRRCLAFYGRPFLGAPDGVVQVGSRDGSPPRSFINLSSYNYLGLSMHPEVVGAAHEALERYGLGACGAPMLSGTFDVHERLAAELAAFKGREACLLFPAGLMANYGALQAMLRKGDVLVMDEKCHQSLVDGATLARARCLFFRHNDAASLDEVLAGARGKRVLVAVEGVYSMDGDLGDLARLAPVCEAHGVPLYVDEAHSTFLFGASGRGVAEATGQEGRVAVSFGTLSKALGGVGGFVCTNAALAHYIRSYASPYVFSCAPSPVVMAGCLAAMRVARRDTALRERLWRNVDRFRTQFLAMGLDLGGSASQIIPIITGASARSLFEMAEGLRARGVFLQPINYPAVPEHQRRFRVSVSALLTEQQIDEACTVIEDVVARRLRS